MESFEKSKKAGEEAIKVMKGVLDGTIPSSEAAKDGVSNATPESVKGVLAEHSNVTKAMEIDAAAADLRHKASLKEDDN